jgi:tetratricopeptide (TPR) repeat protein
MLRRDHFLVLRRDDHKRDLIGAIFLGAISDEEDARRTIERYLGPAFLVRSVEMEGAALRVRVECSRFPVESQNLSRMAKQLVEKGRHRAAGEHFAEALKLDPLNTEALKGQASLHVAAGDLAEAEDKWIRAGEIRGYDGETLRALALIAVRGGRPAAAVQHLENALIVNPEDSEALAMLDELDRQAELRFTNAVAPSDPGKRSSDDDR